MFKTIFAARFLDARNRTLTIKIPPKSAMSYSLESRILFGTRKPLPQKTARKTKEMSKKGRELSRFAAPAAALRFSHVDWMRGRKSSPRASSSRTCSYVAALMRENESKTAGDRVCPTNRKPRRKVKKRKKRGGAHSRTPCARNAPLITRYDDFTRTWEHVMQIASDQVALYLALYVQHAQFATRRVAYMVSFTARRCSTQGSFSPDDWL